MDETVHSQRLDRVENEVTAMRGDISTMARDFDTVRSDVKSLAGILNRIEVGVTRSQEKSEERSERNKPNLTAIVSVLITIISILVGGAWLIGSSLATLNVRTTESLRERDEMRTEMHITEQHVWENKRDYPPPAAH